MRRWLTFVALLLLAVPAMAQGAANPILNHADPFITLHPEAGRYLLLATSGSNVTIWSGPTVETAATNAKTVFTPTDGLRELWSPTLWQVDGRSWIYFTARMPGKEHAVYVLESNTGDALGSYTFKGALDLHGRASIDPSVLAMGGMHYLMYVTVDSGANEIRMVRLAAPMQPVGTDALIAKPEYPWEKGAGTTRNYPVDEGPTALYHAGKTFIVFSGSDTASPRYCLGLLTFKGGDPLQPANWAKSPEPVFSASPEHGIWGPGRGTFAEGKDGTNWLLYAAKSTDAPDAQNRAIRAQRFTWKPDDTPDFGVPAKDGPIAERP
ncbi:glycoside hydrolase family 43 protein [Terriglobus sp.]|uniref:glycoside hydrolase family 43 protein n=1 Tax=Terriglobus sp. TaxID=1889013 RepID=UPI003AFFFDDE